MLADLHRKQIGSCNPVYQNPDECQEASKCAARVNCCIVRRDFNVSNIRKSDVILRTRTLSIEDVKQPFCWIADESALCHLLRLESHQISPLLLRGTPALPHFAKS